MLLTNFVSPPKVKLILTGDVLLLNTKLDSIANGDIICTGCLRHFEGGGYGNAA